MVVVNGCAVPVKLSLVLKRDGRRQGEVLSTSCPSHKSLIDVVRPHLHRQLDQTLLDRGDRVIVKLDVTGASRDFEWSSPARRFAVSFLNPVHTVKNVRISSDIW